MSDLSRAEALCAARGIRLTGARRVILSVLLSCADHPDVEELHRRIFASGDRRISVSTVYRTVALFAEAGILTKHDFKDGRARYEEAGEEHHDHLIDITSGRVIEFVNEAMERLQETIARELGYELVDHRLELYGRPLKPKTV